MDFDELVDQPDVLHTIPEVASVLGMSRPSAALLAVSGAGGPVFRKGARTDINSVLVPDSTLGSLRMRPFVADHPEALVVRVRPARVDPNDPDREFMGWRPDAAAADLAAAIGRWWRIADPSYWHGKTFVATIVGFVVHIATVESHSTHPAGLVAFTLTVPTPEALDSFEGKRLEITQGGVTVHLKNTRER
ncbi:hypothetical protein FK529_03055 [Tsukamurella asaccharolytica]|uniref:Uncharacterized protein n=1 Tax=Tsukamurella asaccharolytica TaxID=2592067 RepID=A0A5C5RFW7_9ACTN|nr:hypothetical protein [Tsukamurella asaccharolytica]TWS21578.1 hypothetical protein FK529_03055 [Tsukamurella asaccharolytica]